jgi:uncharacterized protein with FMN-binding domain
MKEQGASSSRKIANSLTALSSAAILTVYAAGYLRTRSAVERFSAPSAQRRPAAPSASKAAAPVVTAPKVPIPTEGPNATVTVPQSGRESAPPADVASSRQSIPTSAPVPVTPPPAEPERPAEPPALTQAPVGDLPAAQSAQAEAEVPAPALQALYKDGTFAGWGYCRHGDIEATVVVESGKLVAATISQCLTRYPCSWIEKLPPQVVTRQSADVDYVSGATESADAFADAVAQALSKAERPK